MGKHRQDPQDAAQTAADAFDLQHSESRTRAQANAPTPDERTTQIKQAASENYRASQDRR